MQFLQYIELDGNCYYDTGLSANTGTRVEMTFTPMSGYSGEYYFGAMPQGWTTNRKGRVALGRGGNEITYYPVFGNYGARFGSLASGVTDFITWDRYYFTDNRIKSRLTTGSNNDSTTYETMYIGACNCPDFAEPTSAYTAYRAGWGHYGEVKIYYGYSGDTELVGDFIPAEDPQYGVGFYDSVNNRFLSNIGTGTPIAGPAISGPLFGDSAVTQMLINGEEVKEVYLGDRPIYYVPAPLI